MEIVQLSFFDGKVCGTCKQEKLRSEFTRNKNTSDGLEYRCRSCKNAYMAERGYAKKYYQKNRERMLSVSKQWHVTNKERYLQGRKAYNHRNKIDAFTAYGGVRCEICGLTDPDVLAIDHIGGGGQEHRERIGIMSGVTFYIRLRKNNYPPGFRVLCHNDNWKAFLEARRSYLSFSKDAINNRKQSSARRIACFNAYGGSVCAICGTTDIDILTIDHIHRNGKQHRKEFAGRFWTSIYRCLKAEGYPPGYRVLCRNCQMRAWLRASL